MNGFEKRKERKKLDILEAAVALFIPQGYHHISIKEVADMAHVSPVTIFKYFETKENLVDEAIHLHMSRFVEEITQITYSDVPFQEKLQQAIIFKSQQAKLIHQDIYLKYVDYMTEGSPEFMSFIDKNTTLTKHFLKQGKEEGAIHFDLSDTALELYMRIISQGITLHDTINEVVPLIDEIMNLICYGLAGRPQ